MATILVDYENVHGSNGLKGAEVLREDDTLIVFFSESCRKIKREYMEYINDSKCKFVSWAKIRAMVVLPHPGGPHKINEAILPDLIIRERGPFSPNKWSCPTTSDKCSGRILSASGLSVNFSNSVFIWRIITNFLKRCK